MFSPSNTGETAMRVYKALNGTWMILLSAVTGQHYDAVFATQEAAEAKLAEIKAGR